MILYGLSELNLMQHSSPKDLGIPVSEIQQLKDKNINIIAGVSGEVEQIKSWIIKIGEDDGEEFRDEIFSELPRVKDRYEKIKLREENKDFS